MRCHVLVSLLFSVLILPSCSSDNVVVYLFLAVIAGAHAADILDLKDYKEVLEEVGEQPMFAHAPLTNKSNLPPDLRIVTLVCTVEANEAASLENAVAGEVECVVGARFPRELSKMHFAPLPELPPQNGSITIKKVLGDPKYFHGGDALKRLKGHDPDAAVDYWIKNIASPEVRTWYDRRCARHEQG